MGPFIVLGGYAFIGLVVASLSLLLYLRAVSSRRQYRCSNCDEPIDVELMKATHCNVCGSPLRDSNERDPWKED